MSEKEIEEGNKLIAEFLGYKLMQFNAFKPERKSSIYYEKDGSILNIIESKYHSSWDWLMPVIDKIIKLGTIDEECFHRSNGIKDCMLNVELEKTFIEVVDFIKWYNKK